MTSGAGPQPPHLQRFGVDIMASGQYLVTREDGSILARLGQGRQAGDDARRITACLNFCAGQATEFLEGAKPGEARPRTCNEGVLCLCDCHGE